MILSELSDVDTNRHLSDMVTNSPYSIASGGNGIGISDAFREVAKKYGYSGQDAKHNVLQFAKLFKDTDLKYLRTETDPQKIVEAINKNPTLNLQSFQSHITGSGYDMSWKDSSFSQWLTVNIAKGFNDDQDFMIRGIRAVLPKETGDAVVNSIRKWFINNPSTAGNITLGAAGAGTLAGASQTTLFDKLMQKVTDWVGLGSDEAQKAQEVANQGGGINVWHIAAGAGIGAGLLWLYNKFKKNPRQQLTPREMVYAMQLNERTPNYHQQNR